MSARTAALRFRIWQYAAPREWDVTCTEIAEALGESTGRIGQAMRYGNWHSRIRVGSRYLGMANHFESAAHACFAADIASQVVAGRISSEAAI